MHELGLLDAMLKTVDGIMAKETDVSTVSRITVEVGELSGAVPNTRVIPTWSANCLSANRTPKISPLVISPAQPSNSPFTRRSMAAIRSGAQ